MGKLHSYLQVSQARQITYTLNPANRLKTATGTTGGAVDYVQENKYNGFGQRVEKKEGSDVTEYFYDGSAVLYTKDGTGAVTSFNLIGAEDNILSTSRKDADGQTDFYVYTKDIRESTTNVIGKDGLSQVSYTYDEHGETTEYQKNEAAPFYNEICYTAGVYDATTGLYNLNARYYSPEAGVFLTQDTYRGSRSRTGTLNYYAYCAGNPISYTDPSGHWAWAVAGAAMGAYDGYNMPFCPKSGSDWQGKTDSVAAELRRSERSERCEEKESERLEESCSDSRRSSAWSGESVQGGKGGKDGKQGIQGEQVYKVCGKCEKSDHGSKEGCVKAETDSSCQEISADKSKNCYGKENSSDYQEAAEKD